jgi:peroxiredoxin
MKRLTPALTLAFVLLLPTGATAQTQVAAPAEKGALPGEVDHKTVPFKEVKLALKDFSFQTLEGKTINLREAARSGKAVLVTYFAAWCDNSAHDFETIKALEQQYHKKGLVVIGICEYSSRKEVQEYLEKHKPAYPICFEGDDQTKKESTTHFSYRQQCGDERKWGTPFSLLLRSKDFKSEGEIVATELSAANGELIRKDAEKTIRKYLK